MATAYRKRRIVTMILTFLILGFVLISNRPIENNVPQTPIATDSSTNTESAALDALKKLAVKGRAPKTDYTREQFGAGWVTIQGCDTRNSILNRDLTDVIVDETCVVTKGTLNDPYTGKTIVFMRGSTSSSDVQIDHVVALSNAWQTGAQQLTKDRRIELANDPLELLAVDGPANLQKSDGDAATWLPPNKAFRCQYVARQVAVKQKYTLWVTQAEYDAVYSILQTCPTQTLPKA